MVMRVHFGSEIWNKAAAFYVRMNVFVLERSIALKDEFDEVDEDETTYVVVYDGKLPVATGRIVYLDALTVRPGRIAVLDQYQGKGLGAKILQEIERLALEQGRTVSCIHSEEVSAGFYIKQGYKITSDVFQEDGVPCVIMEKRLRTS